MAASDAPQVAALSDELGYPTGGQDVARRYAELLMRPDNGMFVAERSVGVIIGWAHVYGVRLLETDGYAEIGGIVVGGDQRRGGVGRALLGHAEAWAAQAGYTEVRLRSGVHRDAAHLFYVACGYTQSKASYMFRRAVKESAGS